LGPIPLVPPTFLNPAFLFLPGRNVNPEKAPPMGLGEYIRWPVSSKLGENDRVMVPPIWDRVKIIVRMPQIRFAKWSS